MTKPSTTIKSSERSARAKAIYDSLPKDPVTGKLLKRGTVPGASVATPPADDAPAPSPAGGPAAGAPFGRRRGLQRWKPRRSS